MVLAVASRWLWWEPRQSWCGGGRWPWRRRYRRSIIVFEFLDFDPWESLGVQTSIKWQLCVKKSKKKGADSVTRPNSQISAAMAAVTPLLLLLLLSSAPSFSSGSRNAYNINGRVKIPQGLGLGTKGYALPGRMSNVKVLLNGGQNITFLRPDGYFSLYPNIYHSYAYCLLNIYYLLVVYLFLSLPFQCCFP